MPLTAGDKRGPYEIISLIGKGGMGEVYRARDPKLKRDVALKVLPELFARDADRMTRFQREAEVLASLNHHNIATIHGVEDRALVIELVEGNSPKGPLPFDEAWKIASQIAAALEYAHERGIMHRDLKPANIMITPDGVVKLLDFGLAKAFSNHKETSASPENSPTLTLSATEVGVILGTAAYMAPEQARGKPVDKRADIWAFGVVLWEMLTGERLFQGEEITDILASVVKDEPDWNRVPFQIRRMLKSCLEKDPRKRLRDIGDVMRLHDSVETAPSVPKRRGAVLGWAAGAAAIGIAAGVAFSHFREVAPVPQTVRFQLALEGIEDQQIFEISPDGRHLAFTARQDGHIRLWIRETDSLEARALPGTDDADNPFWSPDSATIGFFAQGKLKKIPAAGGTPLIICDAVGSRGGSWNRDGVIIFSAGPANPLYRVSQDEGAPAAITRVADGESHRFPRFLPDGVHFLFQATTDNAETTGLYSGSLNAGEPPTRILADASNTIYSTPAAGVSPGYLLFRRDTTLMAALFDPGSRKIVGEMVPLAQDIRQMRNTAGLGAFSASQNGILIYRQGGGTGAVRQLIWLDRLGRRIGAVTRPALISNTWRLSPNGRKVAITILAPERGEGASDIWSANLEPGSLQPGTLTRLTFIPGENFAPVWSPDGSVIAFTHWTLPSFLGELYRKPANGAGAEERVGKLGVNGALYDWSADGKWIVHRGYTEKTGSDLWLFPMLGGGKPEPYLQTPASEDQGRFSPDGHWMAYVSGESSGRNEVYVQTVPVSGAKRQISTTGGSQPAWSPDGKQIFYLSADRKVMTVALKRDANSGDSSIDAGLPQALFDLDPAATLFEPMPNGQEFLAMVAAGNETATPPLTVSLNWQAGLKK